MKRSDKETKGRDGMDRREFLKVMGAGTALAATSLYGCKSGAGNGKSLPGSMTYRQNPSTGDKVSLLGYGCMRWPTLQEGAVEVIDQEAVNQLVDYAMAHGVNYYDTSPRYVRGLSEKATGIALKRHPREKYFIATKSSNMDSDPDVRSREGTLAMYEQSFRDLQVDYIDYYLLHTVGNGGMAEFEDRYYKNGVLDFLLKEREAGRIRNLGFSFHGDIRVFDHLLARHDEIKWDFVQIQLKYVDWKYASGANTPGEYLYGELAKRHIPVVVMEPLLGGRLASLPPHLAQRLKQRRPEASIASWAFRYAGSFPEVLTVLSGMSYLEHLQDNIKTYSPLEPLTEEESALLYSIADSMMKLSSIPCTACQYCMPCPYGLDIPGIFSHYNRCVNEGFVPESSKDPDYAKARRAFLIGYDRSVPRLRQADHCIGCWQCVHHCPQSINIPMQMQKIDKFVEDLKQGRAF